MLVFKQNYALMCSRCWHPLHISIEKTSIFDNYLWNWIASDDRLFSLYFSLSQIRKEALLVISAPLLPNKELLTWWVRA